MILRLLCTLWTSPFSWRPGDVEVSIFLIFTSSKLSWCFLYLLIPKPVVLLPWDAAAAAVATKLVNCLCLMTLRTPISRLLRVSCARRGQLPTTAKTTVILCHHWYPTMYSALPKPVMCSLIHAILSQASECLEQGQKTVWVTDTGLASESQCECHVSFPWKVLPAFQTYLKPKTEWSSSILFISHFWKEHWNYLTTVRMFLQLSMSFCYPKSFFFPLPLSLATWAKATEVTEKFGIFWMWKCECFKDSTWNG